MYVIIEIFLHYVVIIVLRLVAFANDLSVST